MIKVENKNYNSAIVELGAKLANLAQKSPNVAFDCIARNILLMDNSESGFIVSKDNILDSITWIETQLEILKHYLAKKLDF